MEKSSEPQQHFIVRWLRIAGVAVLNVVVLAFFTAFLRNEPLGLITIISIIADSMSITLGILGIWFFFEAEKLNRTTAVQLETMSTTVNDLRYQLWQMVKDTIAKSGAMGDTWNQDEIRKSIEIIREQAENNKAIDPEAILNAIDGLARQMEASRSNQATNGVPPWTPTISPLPKDDLGVIIRFIISNWNKFPMRANQFFRLLRPELHRAYDGGILIRHIVNHGLLKVLGNDDPTQITVDASKQLTVTTSIDEDNTQPEPKTKDTHPIE
jgi:hypothetical protein